MKVSIIVGSHRPISQSSKVANYLLSEINRLNLFSDSYVLDLGKVDIPFWDEGVWRNEISWQNIWTPIAAELTQSDAFIIVSPEWGGMVPPKLKNLFLLCNSHIMGNKPALIVAVSSGLAGSYPINELRTSSYKNTKICYLPDHIIVRKVEEALNDSPNLESDHDKFIRPRIDHALSILHLYSKAFIPLRESITLSEDFLYGM